LDDRVRELANVIRHECTAPLPLSLSLKPKVIFMFYHSKAQAHIEAHQSHFEVVRFDKRLQTSTITAIAAKTS